jgi:hypothetical protein
MTTLRQAVKEYLQMRRALGFKLHDAGKGLLDFVTFMEQHRARYITQALALAWAQQPSNVQSARWLNDWLSYEDLRIIEARPIPAHRFQLRAYYLFSRSGHNHIYTRMRRFGACCAQPLNFHTAMKAVSCALGSTTVCSGF